jgi:hypothetical protein
MYPQKWNKYAYVQNNPLASIDPDGLDDYKIFITRPDVSGSSSSKAWTEAAASAKAHGHTVEFFEGKDANVAAWGVARADPSARLVFVGDTTHMPDDMSTRTAISLSGGRAAGPLSSVFEIGPVDASGTAQAVEAPFPSTPVNANTVALFGCDSFGLAGQYSNVGSFVGVDSGSDHESSLQALGPAAAAWMGADAAARPASGDNSSNNGPQVNAIDSANGAMQANQHTQDLGDKVLQRTQ